MELLNNLQYTKNHEWVLIEGNIATVGITDYAQGELGDIVFIEYPELNSSYNKGESIGTIEAVKTVADIYSPISGEIVEINDNLESNPELINENPYEDGWILKIKINNKEELDSLLSNSDYEKLIK